jgi:hypothetical protein
MTIDAIPAINLPNLYVSGLQLSVTSNTTLTVQAGQSRDSTNVFDMDLGNFLGVDPNFAANTPTVLTSSVNGLNGLDTGTVAPSTVYAVYVLADPVHNNPPGLIMSLSTSQPTMPFGYGIFRRIGWAITDVAANFQVIYQVGTGTVRTYQYAGAISVLSSGNAVVTTSLPLAGLLPNIQTVLSLNITYLAAAGNIGAISFAGATISTLATAPIAVTSLDGTAANTTQGQILQIGSPAAITYIVTNGADALSIDLNGWVDYL